ncbi:MAG: hypothetical protein Kow0089_04010 [Desulfobulbaceae bacterium]
MGKTSDLWERIGRLEEDEAPHVIARLFSLYEEMLAKNPGDEQALLFFRNLETALEQTTMCNLNRR